MMILDIDRLIDKKRYTSFEEPKTILGFCYGNFVRNGCEYNYIHTSYNFVLKLRKF